MTDLPDDDLRDDDDAFLRLAAGMLARVWQLSETALAVHPERRQRAQELLEAGGDLRARPIGDGVFEFRVCRADGELEGSVLVMRVRRSAVLAGLDGAPGSE
jgi:hypothetical protein